MVLPQLSRPPNFFGHVNVRPLNGQILINWTPVFSYTNVILYLSDNKDDPGQGTDMGQGNTRPGEFEVQQDDPPVPQQDVGRCHVEVGHPLPVEVVEHREP